MTGLIDNKQFRFGIFAGIFILALLLALLTNEYYLAGIPFVFLIIYESWQNLPAVFYILLFSLPLSFEYNFSSSLATDIPGEMLMILLTGLLIFYLISKPQIIPKETWQHPLVLLFIVSLGWTLVSVLFSTNILVSAKYLLAKGWYAGAFLLAPLALLREKKQIRIAALSLSVSMLAIAIIALVRHSQTGFHFAGINDAVSPFFRNHVNYSGMLVCVIPIFVAFYRMSETKRNKTLAGLAITILLLALFFSYARGAWLALVAGWIAYYLIGAKRILTTFVILIFMVIGFLCWIKSNDRYLRFTNDYNTTIFHSDFREHLIATYRLKDVSTAERFYRWVAGTRMLKDNKITGYGPNSFYENYKPYASPAFKTWVSNNDDRSTVHNYFLLITIEQGIPGLIFFILLLGFSLYYAQTLYHRITNKFYKTVAATAGVVLVMIMVLNFLSDLVETDKIGSLFFLCLSMLVIADKKTERS